VPVLEASRAHVQVHAADLEQLGRAPSTISRRLAVLSGFYAYAVAEGAIARNAVAQVRRPRVNQDSTRQGLTRRELATLLEVARVRGAVAHTLVCLLGLNGLWFSRRAARSSRTWP